MIQVNIHEAKTQLSKLIRRALSGEEVVIARDSEPLVRLQVIAAKKNSRRLGGAGDCVLHMDQSFNDPLDEFAEYMK